MNNEKSFSHLNEKGRARMVNVGDKEDTHRIAIAEGIVRMEPETLALIKNTWIWIFILWMSKIAF